MICSNTEKTRVVVAGILIHKTDLDIASTIRVSATGYGKINGVTALNSDTVQ